MKQLTDKELLILAAKAIGLKPDTSSTNGGGIGNDGFCSGDLVLDWHNDKTWNPLTRNSDAFELAIKLRLKIIPGKHVGDGCSVESQWGVTGCTAFDDDKLKQARRAITIVAANTALELYKGK